MEWNHCGHLGIPINKILFHFNPVATEQVSAQSNQKFGKRCRKLIFQDSGCGNHQGFSISWFSYFVSTRCPNAHHQVLIQLDYRGDVQNMNSQHFSHINVHGPYKCMEKQIWPCCKKVKRQHRTIILAVLIDLLSPIIWAKIRAQGLFGYMGMAAILVNGPQPF